MKKPIKIRDLNKLNDHIKDIEKVTEKQLENVKFSTDFQKNVEMIQATFQKCDDLKQRKFSLEASESIDCAIFFISGITNEKEIVNYIIKPIAKKQCIDFTYVEQQGILYLLEEHLMINHSVKRVESYKDAMQAILKGEALFILDGFALGYTIEVKEFPQRGIEEPSTQTLVRGPREGFTEGIKDNLALVRKRIKTPDFKVETDEVGHISKTDIAICYIENIVDPKIVEEVKARIQDIDIDTVLESGILEQLIEDNAFSPFPQIGSSERPDSVAASLAGGRVCIFVDGSPFALVVPQVLTDMLQATEDYYSRFPFSTAIRMLRYFSFLIALLGPSLYVAITTFHHEMIPTELLISIAAARQGVPFPAVVEAFIMEVAFEALREAGVRLPKPVGQAVSIVGALIIGEAAVQAGLVSQIMVIVVAGTGIASFTVPAFNAGISVRLLKIPILFVSAAFGLFGISVAVLALSIHLSTLRSFGVPYLSPVAPMTLKDNKDVVLRAPIWAMIERPTFIAKNNVVRMRAKNMKPRPPNSKQEEENGEDKKTS